MIPQTQVASCGDISCEFLIDPIPRPKPAPFKVNLEPKKRRVVLLDNYKPNALFILQRAQKLLRERGIEVDEEIYRKPTGASAPFPEADVIRLAKEDALILCGISDCGSCSSASSMDAVLLQKRGAAAVPVLTVPFGEQIDRLMAYQTADRRVPAIVLDHPMQMLHDDELDHRARQLADQVEALLNQEAVPA